MADVVRSEAMSPPLISVIVCTHNRANLLRRTLTSLVCQEFPIAGYEILVVDNASSDDTPDVVQAFRDRANVRYLREDCLGLCVARNTGWRAAAGRYVALALRLALAWTSLNLVAKLERRYGTSDAQREAATSVMGLGSSATFTM